MSVLIPPRIYFKGGISWNVATANNNDQWSTYDFPHAKLNWEFLATQTVGDEPITPENYKELFPQWVLTMQNFTQVDGDTSTSWQQMPAEWNYWGGNTSQCIDSGPLETVVTGGQLDYGADPANPPLITTDPIVNLPVQLLGDTSPGGGGARLVDVNPDAFWSSQIYLGGMSLGDPSNSNTPWLTGQTPPSKRMHSRWINFQRNLNSEGKVQIAGVGGCFFQIGLTRDSVQINNPSGVSPLLTALNDALSTNSAAQGIQVRFAAYLTQYWSSEDILKEIPELTDCLTLPSSRQIGDNEFVNDMLSCQYEKLLALWESGARANNPAITRIVGTVGIWDNDEPATTPWQRYVPSVIEDNGFAPNPIGCSSAHIDTSSRTLTVDFGNTIPETGHEGIKYNMGDIQIGIERSGTFHPVATLPYETYNTAAYEKNAGIIDLSIPVGMPLDGRVTVKAQEQYVYRNGTSEDYVVAAQESEDQLVVQTDDRGVYVEQDLPGQMDLHVLYNGPAPKDRDVAITCAQYLPVPVPPGANAGSWQLVGTPIGNGEPRPPVAVFLDGNDQSTVIEVSLNQEGYGTVPLQFRGDTGPGFPTFVFFPGFDLQTPPVLPASIVPVGPGITTLNAFYGCARIMPFDNALPEEFAILWNNNHDPDEAYQFVDEHIFAVYALIYPIMQGIVGTQEALVENNCGIQERTASALIDNTAYMPVTRELSRGKRTVISMWGQLVDNQFSSSFNFPSGNALIKRTANQS